MAKTKHIMTFTRPVAIRKISEIPGILASAGPMTKHQLAEHLGVVSRTAQTYLAELKRRGEIHVVLYTASRPNGGTPAASWTNGAQPEGFIAPVVRVRAAQSREDAKARRARRRAENAANRAKAASSSFKPFRDPWQVYFWGERGMAKDAK